VNQIPVPSPSPDRRGLHHAAAWAELPERTALLVSGGDAPRFIDGFTTAAVSRLTPGQGAEGFFTDARGWVLALANLLRTEAGLWIDAAPGLGRQLAEHLEHYHIREDVAFDEASARRASLLVAGPAATEWLAMRAGTGLPVGHLDHAPIMLGDVPVTIMRSDWYGRAGMLVHTARADFGRLVAWFAETGLPRAAPIDVDAVRIEAGSPEPADIPAKTLPQELCRNARAISFTKGCYLGQETVARIDALGHVNRRLVGLAVVGPRPPRLSAGVRLAGEEVGTITSACLSPRLGCGLGLAIVPERALAAAANGGFDVDGAAARVVTLPLDGTIDGTIDAKP